MLAATQNDGSSVLVLLALIAGGFVAYFLPAFIARFRGHPSINSITIVNLFLGWSLIGWVIALAWSFSAFPQKA